MSQTQTPTRTAILVIDDDETILASMRIALSHIYTVHVCNTAVRGVMEARSKRFAAIILDIKMPGHDGFWAFREIRKTNQTVPIIFNSAYQDVLPPADMQDMYAPFDYLPKNGSLTQLLRVIGSACQAQAAK